MKWLKWWQRDTKYRTPRTAPLILALEQRMMFDGAVAATVDSQMDSLPPESTDAQESPQDTPQAVAQDNSARQVVFIDGVLATEHTLLSALPQDAEVILLDPGRNGLEQMAEYLDGRKGIDAIHLLSHGESGAFKAGNTWVSGDNLADYGALLEQIGKALSADGDILLYGCKTGEGASGAALVTELARLTQADVAASSNNTGVAHLGGDWVLETQAGVIEAASLAASEFDALLAAPTSLDFDSVAVDGTGRSLGGSPRVFDGWTVSLVDGSGNNAPDSGGTPSYLDVTRNSTDTILANDGSDKALKVEGWFDVVKEARFTATSGEEFWLQSFHLENVNMGTAVRVIGYRDGVEVASQDFTASLGTDTTVTLNHGGDQDWQNIDQFRIVQQNGTADLYFYIDDIVVSAAVLPNVAPTATNLTQTVAYTEDPGGSVALGDIVVTDPDGSDSITATLSLSNPAAGALTTGTFGSATSTYNGGTGVWTVTGSVSDVNAALAAVAFNPTANWDQDVTITTCVRDAANTGPADGTITLDVTPVNDAPTATNLTQSKAATEGGGAVALDDIVVTDPDTGDTITATLTLSDHAAGSLSTGTFGSATSTYNAGTGVWTVTGSVADVNAALAAVALTPSADNDQNFTITTRIRDAAGTGPADGAISVTVTPVNDAPVVTTSGGTSAFTENGSATVIDAGLTLSDVDNITFASATVAITGNFATGQDLLAFTNDGSTMGNISASYNAATGVLTLTSAGASATLAQWQAALRSVTYSNSSDAPSTANRTISFTVNDGDADSDAATKQVSVTAVNDAPVVTAPGSIGVTEDVATALTGISFSDVDAGSSSVTVTFSVGSGSLAATSGGSVTVGGTSSALTLTGSIVNINTFIAGSNVSFTTAANATTDVTLTVGIDDGGNTGSGGAQTASETVTLQVTAVNDAPVISAPVSINVDEDVSTALTGISFIDVDAGSGSLTATFSVGSGSLSATSGSGVTVAGSGTGSLTLTGSLADLNAFIAASQINFLTALNATGNVVLSVEIDDGGNTGSGGAQSDSTTVTLVVTAVNDAPVNSVPGAQSVDQDSVLVFSSGNGNPISVSDVDAGGASVRVTLTASNGLLTLGGTTGLSFINGSGTADTTMTFEGSLADINLALNGLAFSPTGGYNGPASLQIVSNDLGNSGSGGSLSDDDTIAITVNSLNPKVTGVQVTNPDGGYKVGDVITVTVAFDQVVTVNTAGGTPTLLLETGSVDREASYVSGSGSNTLSFSYTVQAGDLSADLDYHSTGALTLNGATIRSATSDDAILTLPALGSADSIAGQHDILIDGVAPTVGSVSVPANGTYVAGENLDFTVNFDEAVLVDTAGGTPRIAITLDSGGTVYANYLSGSGTMALVFRAQVGNGQLDLDGISLGSTIDSNGGHLRDAIGNDANTTLNAVGDTTMVHIDSVLPTATIIREGPAIIGGDSVSYLVEFSETVNGVELGHFTLSTTGNLTATITKINALGGSQYRVIIGNITGEGTLSLQLTADNQLVDNAGNPLNKGATGDSYTRLTTGGDPEFRVEQGTQQPTPEPTRLITGLLDLFAPQPLAANSSLLSEPTSSGITPLGNIFLSANSSAPSYLSQVFSGSTLVSSDVPGNSSTIGSLFSGGFGSLSGGGYGLGGGLGGGLSGGPGGGFGDVFGSGLGDNLDGGLAQRGLDSAVPSLTAQLQQWNEQEQRQQQQLARALAQLAEQQHA